MDNNTSEIKQIVGEEGIGEPDTCRICRGEGDPSESLFHPCKCSGSIKFVHQACLMEWLSHSQKKHCELCKTAFRLTKLYSPNMPQSLPFHVLIQHILIHSVETLITFSRLCLVVMVWLGVLPYSIRQVWRFLFWFSESGWPPSDLTIIRNETSNINQALQLFQAARLGPLIDNGTSLTASQSANITNSTTIRLIADKLIEFVLPLPNTYRVSEPDGAAMNLYKSFYHWLGVKSSILVDRAANKSSLPVGPLSSSLLSDVSFFTNLTKNPPFNQLIINIAEGYIITVLVVVCFVLVFLIREWVVQQQPGINMGAGFNAQFAANDRPRDEQQVGGLLADIDEGNDPINEDGTLAEEHIRQGNYNLEHRIGNENLENNLLDQGKNTIVPVVGIQRVDADEPRMTREFIEIWSRAEGDPLEALRIIEIEGKSEHLRNWVKTTKVLRRKTEASRHPSRTLTSEYVSLIPSDEVCSQLSTDLTDNIRERRTQADWSSPGNLEAWVAEFDTSSLKNTLYTIDQGSNFHTEDLKTGTSSNRDKGKSRSQDRDQERSSKIESLRVSGHVSVDPSYQEFSSYQSVLGESRNSGSSSRPRSLSDSPQLKRRSPLSTNSWSFPRVSIGIEGDPLEETEKARAKMIHESSNENLSIREKLDELVDFNSFAPEYKAMDLQKHSIISNDDSRTANDKNAFLNNKRCDRLDESLGEDEIEIIQQTSEASVNLQRSNAESQIESITNDNLQLNSLQPEARPQIRQQNLARAAPRTLYATVTDYLWGGIDNQRLHENLEANLETNQNFIAEGLIVPAIEHEVLDQEDHAEVNDEIAEVVNAAGVDFNDPDAIEDVEDFEGIMELLGMRGPIFSLIQNALFSALLLGLTITIGVWLPYNIGGVSLLLIANPGSALKVPLRIIFGCAAFLQDLALSIFGLTLLLFIQTLALPNKLWLSYFGQDSSFTTNQADFLISTAKTLTSAAFQRIKNDAVDNVMHITDSELSAACHESLITIRNLFISSLSKIGVFSMYLFNESYDTIFEESIANFKASLTSGVQILGSFLGSFAKSDFWVISLDRKKRVLPIDPELSIWDGTDRFFAVATGYIVLCTLGTIYVRKRSPLLVGQVGREMETAIIDLLNQAGGVLKVILIISIEMLAFPLYCGLLLDISLLPLFENTTISSRVLFTQNSPLSSIFVHWFVGTCYMFHFALFVSMCRKIMRKGVLYFIRDPDDPTFHPVRDVLERNVATQLQKILFSALIYGGLILICLGGVIWGIAFAFNDVLPVHWSSSEPVLEFPIDLLFYNFLIPLTVRFFKPSVRLHAMYNWWFRQCARALRLSWFMFDERRLDEEGHLVRKTWGDIFRGSKGDPYLMVTSDDSKSVFENNPEWRAFYRRDGRYVRAPASDQVRIPKDSSIFLEVTEMNSRIDHKPDQNNRTHERDSSLYKQVYVPPWFRLRISIFIISIWIFAAITGVGLTIIPLIFGRVVFAKIVPLQVHRNDAYAFSIGIYILGSIFYFILNLKKLLLHFRAAVLFKTHPPKKVFAHVLSFSARVARITWTYTAFLFILPILLTFSVEFYLIVPLRTYLTVGEKHIIHFIQSWTLGLLYVKLATRLILWYEDSRPAHLLRAVTRNGYLDPDARLATRGFILPGVLLLSSALFYPWALARLTVMTILQRSPEKHTLAYRYSYPICLFLCFFALFSWVLTRWVRNWKIKIRDEIYLVGEQLHNFVERKVQPVHVNNVRRSEALNFEWI